VDGAVGLVEHWLRIGGGEKVGPRQHGGSVNAALRKRPQEVGPLAVLPDHAEGTDLHAKRGQVGRYVPSRAGAAADGRHLMGFEAGLQRDLRQRAVDVQIAIQEIVADDSETQRRQAREDRFEARTLHGHPPRALTTA